MIFNKLKSLVIPEGSVKSIACNGVTLWKKSKLPVGYTDLDYIETTGSGSGSSGSGQYIDTGFKPNQDSRIVCEFMFKGGAGIYGARNSTSSNNFALRVISSKWQPGYYSLFTTNVPSDTTKWHVADQNKNVFSIDGVVAAEFEYRTVAPPYSIYIGAIHAGSTYYGSGRYRTCQIYDNGVLVRDFLPCKNPGGEVGMYDLVNGKFYGNAGTGEFVTG